MGGVFKPIQGVLSLLLVLTLMTGCGEAGIVFGADDGEDDFDERELDLSIGPVAGFGLEGLVVNGRTFGTLGTEVFINDVDSSLGGLEKGMLALVDVGNDPDSAALVVYEDDLRGPALAEDYQPLTGTIEVLGQTVRFTNATVFAGPWSREELPELFLLGSNRAFFTVSGWRLDTGEYLASYVNASQYLVAGLGDAKVRGPISDISPSLDTFRIGDLLVELNASTRIDMDNAQDRLLVTDIGAFVEVEGYVDDIGGNLVAQEIQEEDWSDRLDDIDGARLSIEGSITRALAGVDRRFELSGITVQVDDDTALAGLEANDLRLGRRIVVDGVGESDSVVVADRILDREPKVEVAGAIQDIEPSLDDSNRVGRLLIGGVPVAVTLRTLVVDSESDLENFDIAFGDLVPGEFVEVAGVLREEDDGDYIDAVKVERNLPFDDSPFLLEAFLDEPVDRDAGVFDLLGLTLGIDGSTGFQDPFVNVDSLRVGDRLRVGYRSDNAGFVAEEIGLDEAFEFDPVE